MRVEASRLSRLVKEIIELSRLQGDDPLENPGPVDINAVIEAAVDRCRVDAEDRDIKIVVKTEPALEVMGSEDQLSIAIGNLVENAVNYSPDGTRVAVAAHPIGDLVEVTVSDQGVGHPEQRPGTHLRAVLPGRPGPQPRNRWHRPRPLDRQAHRLHPRRRRAGLERRGPGFHLHRETPAAARTRRGSDRLLQPGGAGRSPDAYPVRSDRKGDSFVTRVLVVEDEESYSDALSYVLRKEGFEVAVAETGPDALDEYDRAGADIVLLDLMLPGLSGTEVCRALRSRGNVPVIIVSAKDTEVDKVVGLELGADDYVTKPYSPRELLARVRAVLRRGQDVELLPDTLEAGPVRMDVERHVVTVSGTEIRLPLKEFELLEMLLRNTGRVLTRGQLIDRIWGADYVGDTKTLDVHVKRLRSKLEKDPSNPQHLVTVRGLGYKFET